MIYRRFGRTEIQMPVFTCGGMRYQHSWQDQPLDEIPADNQKNLEQTITRAVDLGINHIETAHGYGSSERQLGGVLPKFDRDKIIVETKVSPRIDVEDFIKCAKESIERLNLEYIDLFALHGINDYQTYFWATRKGGCLEAARELQAQGLVRHVGFSTHGLTEIITEAIHTDVYGGFDFVNLHWFYIYQNNYPAIVEAAKRDMGVFIISPSDKGGMLFDPPDKLVELTKPLDPMVFNDLFCLSDDKVHTLSIGAAKPTDFDTHLETLKLLDDSEKTLAPIIKRLEAAMYDAVGEDFAKHWQDKLNHWYHVPHYINIPMIVWLRNLAKAYDMVEYGKMRYNLLGNADCWFPGCNASQIDQLDFEKILGKNPYKDQLKQALYEARDLLGAQQVQRLSKSE